MKKAPKVSVLTPLYHTDLKQLDEMIQSVLVQTWTDFEFLLLNDSPDDLTLKEKILSYSDPRIRYIENEQNCGISRSRNILIEEAKGEYLAILDHDDICYPDRLKLQVEYLDQNKSVGVVSGGTSDVVTGKGRTFPEDNFDIKKELMYGCCVVHSAAMIRKSVLIQANIRYEEIYSPAEDYRLWIRLIEVTMFHNLKAPLIKYRNHQNNTSHRQAALMRDRDMVIKSEAWRTYPYLKNCSDYWYYLFSFIPFIKSKNNNGSIKFYLFGVIPFIKIKVKRV